MCVLVFTCMWVCERGFVMCARASIFISVCVCVGGGGSLVSLLNIKQLEVIKYLGSAGSLRILILPFPSVSQISLSFSLLSLSYSPPLFLPSTLTHPSSFFITQLRLSACPLSPLHPCCLWSKLSLTLRFPVALTLFMRESQPFNWESAPPTGTEGDGGRREELT